MSEKIRYDSRITPEFVMACAKVGSVSVFSSQVCITGRNELLLKDLIIPSCFQIEWIGIDERNVKITLKLMDQKHGA
jgi:hypothetical protein